MNPEASFRLWFLVLVACAVAVLSGRVHAQGTCYEWGSNGKVGGQVVGWWPSPRMVDERLNQLCVGNAASCGCGQNSDIHHRSGGSFTTWPTYEWKGTCTRGETVTEISGTYQSRTMVGGCPVCPPVGSRRSSIIEGGANVGDEVCGSDGCAYTVTSPLRTILLMGGFGEVASVESRGRACASRPETADDEVVENRECVDGAGNIACLDAEAPSGEGCGWFNGDYVCTGHVPDGSCVAFASGAVACTVGAASAPTDSNGDPAEPLGSVTNGVKTVNYYDSVTVNNSSTTVQTSPGQGGSGIGAPGRDGSGGGIGSGGGSGDGTGDGDVCPSGDCSGVGGPGLEEVCTIAECTQTFLNRVRNAPLLAAIANAGSSVPEGTCPSISINFGIYADDSYSLTEPMCEIYDQLAVFISPLFLLLWAWIGTRIVVSA